MLVATSPSGDAWLHEVKHSGYRAIAVVDASRPRIFSRRGRESARASSPRTVS
jgi:ATP-dependent DNA ligase